MNLGAVIEISVSSLDTIIIPDFWRKIRAGIPYSDSSDSRALRAT
ncbi:hypothetical protein [Gloeothece verrucosa]|nr:hypothetical protein [Gloeothece verrucosa]